MFKIDLTFPDLDGDPVTETFFFHLSAAEITEKELESDGAFSGRLKALISSQSGAKAFIEFKDILNDAIGVRGEDGRQFVKNQAIRDKFFQSEAYTTLLLDWLANPEKAIDAINAIFPSNLEEIAKKLTEGQNVTDNELPPVPAWIAEDRDPTKEEFKSMTTEQVQDAFRRKEERAKKTSETPTTEA